MQLAVVGHIEWVEFASVDHVPARGEVVHGRGSFFEPAGGGAVAAVELAGLAGACTLFTALGPDEPAERSLARLGELGVRVHAARRTQPTRRALTLIDGDGERTIATLGERLEPRGEDPLPWDELARADGVYVTAGDAAAVRAARAARVLVASPRTRGALADVELDALVLSARDPIEATAAAALRLQPALRLHTEGAGGGRWESADGAGGRWTAHALDGPVCDFYGCGDSFAAALTYGLAAGAPVADAIELAAERAAACALRQGPYRAR